MMPSCFSKSMPFTCTLAGSHSNIGTKRVRVSMVMRKSGCWVARAWSTGTVMAASPIALKRMTSNRLMTLLCGELNMGAKVVKTERRTKQNEIYLLF